MKNRGISRKKKGMPPNFIIFLGVCWFYLLWLSQPLVCRISMSSQFHPGSQQGIQKFGYILYWAATAFLGPAAPSALFPLHFGGASNHSVFMEEEFLQVQPWHPVASAVPAPTASQRPHLLKPGLKRYSVTLQIDNFSTKINTFMWFP